MIYNKSFTVSAFLDNVLPFLLLSNKSETCANMCGWIGGYDNINMYMHVCISFVTTPG